MGWFSGSQIRRAPSSATAAPVGHRSLALKLLLDALRPGDRPTVLDLGPAISANIEFLSALSCRVRVADLHRSLKAEPVESREPAAFDRLLETVLPLPEDERFDALLAWDVLNYLRRDQIASLMARLLPRCRRGALVLTFVWTRARIPPAPLRYEIVSREYVAYKGAFEPSRPGPRYLQVDLERSMSRLAVKNSFLLRNGIQECLFANG